MELVFDDYNCFYNMIFIFVFICVEEFYVVINKDIEVKEGLVVVIYFLYGVNGLLLFLE